MVRHHIVPELRPLCVSVLESDLDSRRQLESAVGGIAERLSRADAGSFEIDAEKLETERHQLLGMLDDLRRQLTEARADEYKDVAIGDQSWPPAEAARKVAREKEPHGWIPGSVAAGVGMPLGEGELADLYRTNVSVSRDDENELSGRLPELADLPRPEEFDETLREKKRLSARDLDFRSDLWPQHPAAATPEQLESITDQMMHAVDLLSSPESWKLAAIYAGRYGGAHRQPWYERTSPAHRPRGKEAKNPKKPWCSSAIRSKNVSNGRRRSGRRCRKTWRRWASHGTVSSPSSRSPSALTVN